ncbi:uncharacterized protein LOC143848155 isoform X2 [Tasmannia lanceolata]
MDESKVVMDSCLRSSIPTEENSFAFEFRRSSSKEACGTPMKMLLAEEMSKEKEFRRRSPNVIARLMGLDALPIQQHVHKQQKKMSEDYFHRTAGLQEKCVSHEDHSFGRNNFMEQEEFKDVFEVMKTSKVEKHITRPVQKEMMSSKLSEAKVNFIRQKFMDAKRLSTDKNLRQSKEFLDALEVLDSNKDLFLKFLQEPNSLFTKHLHDLQTVPIPPQPSHVKSLKSSKAVPETGDICWNPERKTEGYVQMQKVAMNSLQKHENGNVTHSKHSVTRSHKSMKSGFEVNSEECFLPTRIVVLKPSFGKAQNMDRAISSPSSSESSHSVNIKRREYRRRLGNRELFPELRHQPTLANNVELIRQSKDSREIAREITRQMRQTVGSDSIHVLTSGRGGRASNGSSYNMSAKDSPNLSEELTPTSGYLYDWSNRYSPSSSRSTESSVSREAKKQLSERWKMTHRFREVGVADRGSMSTLGEMLALPDTETSPGLDSVIGQDGSVDKSVRNEALERWDCPLGISSRDGWKDEFPKNLSRSRSLPASSDVRESPKTSIKRGALSNDTRLMFKEANNLGPNKSFKENFSKQKETLSSRSIKYGTKKSQCFLSTDMEDSTIRDIHVSPDALKNELEARDQSEQRPLSSGGIGDHAKLTDQVIVAECEDSKMSLETHEEKLPEPSCMMLANDRDSTASDKNDLIMEETSVDDLEVGSHCHVTEPESPQSSKETEQPSPVSVLEPLFEVEVSSPECFERLSADLHGLRMQLQLLKLESTEPFTDGSEITASSDEDTGEGCDGLLEEKEELSGIFKDENRPFSFLLDVLVTSGFHGAESKMLFPTWYSSEFPVDPVLFEKLENKYGKHVGWLRSERKLLFDRINSGLVEILRPCMERHPWVMPKRRRTWVVSSGEALAEEAWQWLVRQSKEVSGNSPEKIIGREVGWIELEEDVDTLGMDIERLLIDDLMEEVMLELSSCGEM